MMFLLLQPIICMYNLYNYHLIEYLTVPLYIQINLKLRIAINNNQHRQKKVKSYPAYLHCRIIFMFLI